MDRDPICGYGEPQQQAHRSGRARKVRTGLLCVALFISSRGARDRKEEGMRGAQSEGGSAASAPGAGLRLRCRPCPGLGGAAGGPGPWQPAGGCPCSFSRRGGPRLLPPSLPHAFPPLRSLWQEAVLSADGHGEGISEAEGSLLALLQEEEISAFPAASPPPPGHAGHGLEGPSTEEGENPAPRRALAHLPLPCKPPGAGDPLSPCPFSLAPSAATVPGAAQRTPRRSSCSARPARWCRASRCLCCTLSKCCSSSV